MVQGTHDGRYERQSRKALLKNKMKRVNKDCPFSIEELDEFRAVLYSVNTSFRCCNAAPIDWVAGWQRHNIRVNSNHN